MDKVKEPRVAIESFRPYYSQIMRYCECRFVKPAPEMSGDGGGRKRLRSVFEGVFDRESFLKWSGLSSSEFDTLKKYMSPKTEVHSLPLHLVDQLMTAYGIPDQVCTLYLVTQSHRARQGIAYSRYERELCQAA